MDLISRSGIEGVASAIDDGEFSLLPIHTDVCPKTHRPYSIQTRKGVAYCTNCHKAIGTLFE